MTTVLSSSAAPTGPAILAEITANVAAGKDLRELLDRFLEPIVRLAQARAGAVRMLSADGDRFELVSTIGLPPGVQDAERLVERECGFCGRGAQQGQVASTHELSSCAARNHGEFFGRECKYALAVPLQHKNRVLGVYNLFFAAGDEPSPGISGMLRSIGELLGLALDNHRLEAENLRATVTQERQMMAAEVHDTLAQSLTFIKMRLPLLRDAIAAQNQEGALAYLEDVRETLSDANGSLREIVTHFRTCIDPRGLARALDRLTARFCLRTGISLHVNNLMRELPLAEAAQVEVFHIIHEALANIERHSGARHSWLSVEPAVGGFEIRIEDDGVGATLASPERGVAHYGLEIMRERAHRLGGELFIQPRPEGGTVVRCTLPLPAGGGLQ